jgi:hypothetical protein
MHTSLRDYFAVTISHGIVSSIRSEADYRRLRELGYPLGLTVSQWIARDAYKQADALLAERDR